MWYNKTKNEWRNVLCLVPVDMEAAVSEVPAEAVGPVVWAAVAALAEWADAAPVA